MPTQPKTIFSRLGLCCWRNVVRRFDTVDHVLRHSQHTFSLRRVLAVVLVCGPLYGLAMGSYAWFSNDRSFAEQIPQMIYSASKVPLLIGVTLVVSIPSFFVINSLFGLRDDFPQALTAIVSAQSGLTIVLSSLLPVTLMFYVSVGTSSNGYSLAILFNAAIFGIASLAGQSLLRDYYRPLIDSDRRHRWMVRLWIVVYAFVGIQAAYVLRPFIGSPNQTTTFFRRESFQNAYIKIIEMVWELFGTIT